MNRRALLAGALAAPMVGRQARAQTGTVRIAKHDGLQHLPLMVMERERLLEKHARTAGLPGLRAEWTTLGGSGATAEAILAGQLDFGVAGVASLATLWDKTVGTAQEVLALSAVQSMPFLLMTGNPALHSIADLSETDRIAVPEANVSAQALLLQMAAASLWGQASFGRLDRLTVTMPHPDAMAALLSGSGVDCHYAVSPFYQYELASGRLRCVLKSYDTFGGHHTNGTLIGTKRFREANPAVVQAVLGAQEEANALINKHPQQAAAIYIQLTKDTRSDVPEMARVVADPDNDWTTTPLGVQRMLEFMHAVGRLNNVPPSWKNLFMPEAHGLAGS